MPDKRKFEEFVAAEIIAEADKTGVHWQYTDGTSMTEDARAFLAWYQKLNRWVTVIRELYSG